MRNTVFIFTLFVLFFTTSHSYSQQREEVSHFLSQIDQNIADFNQQKKNLKIRKNKSGKKVKITGTCGDNDRYFTQKIKHKKGQKTETISISSKSGDHILEIIIINDSYFYIKRTNYVDYKHKYLKRESEETLVDSRIYDKVVFK